MDKFNQELNNLLKSRDNINNMINGDQHFEIVLCLEKDGGRACEYPGISAQIEINKLKLK